MAKLSFDQTDHTRELGALAEWLVGDYKAGSTVGERGELTLILKQFAQDGRWYHRPPIRALKVCAFTDGLGSLRELLKLGVLDAIERLENPTPSDVTNMLTAAGLRDQSRARA